MHGLMSAQSTCLAAFSTDPIRIEDADTGTVVAKLACIGVEILAAGLTADRVGCGREVAPVRSTVRALSAVTAASGLIDESDTGSVRAQLPIFEPGLHLHGALTDAQ